MAVAADGEGSTVTLTTDFTVVGRVAQFGRGIMEDVSRHLVGQAAECIQSKLEAPPAACDAGTRRGGANASAAIRRRRAPRRRRPRRSRPRSTLSRSGAPLRRSA